MHFLIIAATAAEITPFLDHYRKNPGGLPACDVLVTGAGLVATTWALTRQLHTRRPGFVIQAGIGGCFDRQLPLGTAVAVRQDAVADQGVMEAGKLKTLFDLGLAGKNKFPYTGGWLKNDPALLKQIKLKKVNGISCNEISTSPQKIKWYLDHFNPVIESMEGAALHYVCLAEKIPFLQLRSASNYIGERNKKKWKIRESIANLNGELIRTLNQFGEQQ